jgi:hypothetical protein
MKTRDGMTRKGASVKSALNSLAVLVLLASVALAAAPAFSDSAHSAAANGSVTLSVTILPHGTTTPLPLTDLQAQSQGSVVLVSWTNPATPYSGTLVEAQTDHAHRGTSTEQTWRENETFYPPARWARFYAPMGARYTFTGTEYYDGGATKSVPTVVSVVVTAPVEVSSSCPTSGYAPSEALIRRYGDARYRRLFEARLQAPGGVANYTLGTNPISWSPQLTGASTVTVYRLTPVSVSLTRLRSGASFDPALLRGMRSVFTKHYWQLVGSSNGTFADGYPALSSYALVSSVPGSYKLVMQGELAEGFANRGARGWSVTRYITLSATRHAAKLTTPRVRGRRVRTSKIRFTGTLTPRRAATVKVRIQQKRRGAWRSYKTVSVKSKATGAWSVRTRVKKKGTFRVRATVVGGIVDPYHEYSSGISRWRGFKVR